MNRLRAGISGILIVYGAGLLQGLAMVSFPASATVLKDIKGFSNAEYGSIFIPQIVAAIIGSVAAGGLAGTLGLKKILAAALIAAALSLAAFGIAVEALAGAPAYDLVLVATALFGLSFGAAAAPLNTYPGLLFPQKKESGLVALHTLLGLGLSAGPLLVAILTNRDTWWGYPLVLVGLAVLLLGGLIGSALPTEAAEFKQALRSAAEVKSAETEHPLGGAMLWVFLGIAVLYALAEGTLSNWAVLYLHEGRGIALSQASFALSVFWAMMVAGRLAISLLLLKLKGEPIWLTLPVLMIGAFLLLPMVGSALSGIAAFAFAGLACSGFFPLTVSLVSKRYPASTAMVSSLMVAGLMLGVGAGTFVIGALRRTLTFESLFAYAALYPTAVLALALAAVFCRVRHAVAGTHP